MNSMDLSTHGKYVAATGENIGYREYLELRAYWAELGGNFFGPNVEHGSMPESKLLPLLRRLRLPEPQPERKHDYTSSRCWCGEANHATQSDAAAEAK